MFYVYMIPIGLAVNLLVDIAVRATFLTTFRIWNNTDGWQRALLEFAPSSARYVTTNIRRDALTSLSVLTVQWLDSATNSEEQMTVDAWWTPSSQRRAPSLDQSDLNVAHGEVRQSSGQCLAINAIKCCNFKMELRGPSQSSPSLRSPYSAFSLLP